MRNLTIPPSSLPARLFGWLAAALLIVSPLALGWGLMEIENTSFTDLFPLWSDEIYYWHQAATFARVGFENGPYSVGETPAQVGGYHAWGLAAPLLYGSIGRVTGWPLWAIPAANLGLMSVALALWVAVLRPRLSQMLFMLLLLGTFAPFLTLISSSMFELVQYGWALILASVLTVVLARPSAHALRWGVAALAVACLVALFRVTWGIIIPVVGLVALRSYGRRGLIAGGLLGVGLAALMYLVYTATAAPYSEYAPHFKAFSQGVSVGLQAVATHIRVNLDLFLHGERIEMVVRAQVLIIWGLVVGSYMLRYALGRLSPERTLPPWMVIDDVGEVTLHTLLLMGQLFLIVVVYDVGSWRDYRLLSPHLLMSAALLVGRRRWLIAGVMLLMACVLLPITLDTTQEWTQDYRDQGRILTHLTEWDPKIDAVVQYDPRVVNPWCNTLTHSVYFAFVPTYLLLAVEPGIGLTILLSDADVRLPFKAAYLLLDNDFITRHAADLNVTRLLDVPGGVLYRNLEAGC